jgi:chromosome condensin MukBEF MukE localization factor
MADIDEVSPRVTVRLDGSMRTGLVELRKDHFERTGEMVEDARLIRMVLRRALGSDMDRAAVSESLLLVYQLNQVVISRLIKAMENQTATLVAEARGQTELEPDDEPEGVISDE